MPCKSVDAAMILLEPIGNNAVGWIIWGDTYLHAISNHYLDSVFFHSTGEHRTDHDIIFTADLFETAAKSLRYHALKLNQIGFTQNTPFAFVLLVFY